MFNNIKRLFNNIKRWLSYFKVVTKIYDFDYSSILKVEEHQLKRVRDSISRTKRYVGVESDLEKMNLALKLLDIIKEGGCAKAVGQTFFLVPKDDDYYELVRNPEAYWTIPVYVNTRNYKRFWLGFEKMKGDDALRESYLRVEKAWYLYHKLRLYYLRNFWD